MCPKCGTKELDINDGRYKCVRCGATGSNDELSLPSLSADEADMILGYAHYSQKLRENGFQRG